MISVIIVNYHSAHLTKRAVESVLHEDEAIEIFVVDNSASNEERLFLKSLLPGRVNLIFNKANEGFGKACNRAYAISAGEWIFLLNPDAYLLPGALKALKKVLIDNPHAGAAGPRIFWDEERHFILPPNYLPRPSHEFFFRHRCRIPLMTHLYALRWRWWAIEVLNSEIPLEQTALSGGSVLVGRSAIEASGGLFDENFFLYYEDADLFLRLRKTGYKLYLVNGAAAVHNYNQTPENDVSKMEHLQRSHYIYMKKHFKFRHGIINELNKKMRLLNSHRKLSDMKDLGRKKNPFSLDVPEYLKAAWLFEWSHDPNLFPAAIMRGKGETFEFPEKAWSLFRPGRFFGRFSAPDVFFVKPATLRWEVA